MKVLLLSSLCAGFQAECPSSCCRALASSSLDATEARPCAAICLVPGEGQGRKHKIPHSCGQSRNIGAQAGSATGHSQCWQSLWQCWAGRYGCTETAGTLLPTLPRKLWDPCALMGLHRCVELGSACGRGSRAAPQACHGSRPAQHLWFQPCVIGLCSDAPWR